MLVGEGPGEQEDRQGKPFVGRAGQLLDRMLAAIGLDRTKVYIANMVPWRPPGNRNPTPDELAQCAPFLHRQVELVNPKLVVTLGNVPTQALFATNQGSRACAATWKPLEIGSWSGTGPADAAPGLPAAHAERQGAGVEGYAEPEAGDHARGGCRGPIARSTDGHHC